MPDVIVRDAEGNESTVTVPEGYHVLSNTQLDERLSSAAADDENYMLKSSLGRRLKNYIRIDEAHDDPDVVAKVLQANQVESSGIDEDQLKRAWNDEIGAPLRETNDALTRMIKGQAIREAFRDVLKPEFTTPGKNGRSWAEMEFDGQVGIDNDKGRVLALREDGEFRPSRSADNNGYMTISEFAKVVKEDPAYKAFLVEEEKGGAGADPGRQEPGKGGKGKVDLLERYKQEGRGALSSIGL